MVCCNPAEGCLGRGFRGGSRGSISAHSASGSLHPSSFTFAFFMLAPLVRDGSQVNEASLMLQDLRDLLSRPSRCTYWDRL